MLLEIAHEMENAPRDFGKAITASCGGLLALYSMATGLGYYYRGARVAGFKRGNVKRARSLRKRGV